MGPSRIPVPRPTEPPLSTSDSPLTALVRVASQREHSPFKRCVQIARAFLSYWLPTYGMCDPPRRRGFPVLGVFPYLGGDAALMCVSGSSIYDPTRNALVSEHL